MEKILVFHLADSHQFKLKQIAATLKIRCEFVSDSLYMQTIESLVGGKTNPLVQPFSGEVPEESLLLMCDFTDKKMDKLLLALRKNSIPFDYKAALTPTNQKWNVLRLLVEMRAEKAAYMKQNL